MISYDWKWLFMIDHDRPIESLYGGQGKWKYGVPDDNIMKF